MRTPSSVWTVNGRAGTRQWWEATCWTVVIAGQAYRRLSRPDMVDGPMAFLALLADRAPQRALPALVDLHVDLKAEPLAASSLTHVLELEPEAVLVDAVENPGQAWAVLTELRSRDARVPAVVIAERDQLERYPWHEMAEELLYPGTPIAELRLRLAMLRRRSGAGDGSVIRLGPLALDTESYRVTASGRPLDLTFKEFELLRFLASHPGRVYTRPTLLREVWGFDFYGGTRTVDVHVRRLRAKLGPEHEELIETVRSVGYRAAEASGS
jgi:DNA-binding response OmpR family regulator